MFGIGANELIIILIFGFIIFGPDKLPGMAKTVGQFIARFRNAQNEMNKVIRTEVYDPNSDDPFKNPLDALSKLESQAKKEDRGESFTERKARYDKQRAAKKAAEERKAEMEAKKAAEAEAKQAALDEGKDASEAAEAAKAAGEAVAAKAAEKKAASKSVEEKKRPTADELYGTKPQAKKPQAKKPATESASAQDDSAKDIDAKAAAQRAAAGPVDKVPEEASDNVQEAPEEGKGE
ncbi:MAG: twin-arginine translocase TatA/TatE family subunit [Eggerthellaceae bacterium]|nr:twin-arginine translocase TatA/TatE family subunit [Eggerthellaceae bacterium]